MEENKTCAICGFEKPQWGEFITFLDRPVHKKCHDAVIEHFEKEKKTPHEYAVYMWIKVQDLQHRILEKNELIREAIETMEEARG